MGYDLSVTHVPYVVMKDTTAHKLMMQLMKLLSNGVPYDERQYESQDDWYATALWYIYFDQYHGKGPLGWDQYRKQRDCRGCYSRYVEIAYVLSCVFVWNVVGICRYDSMSFHGDDGTGMVTIRHHSEGLRAVITKDDTEEDYGDDAAIKVNSVVIPKEIIDRIRRSIIVGDHLDEEDPDVMEPDEDVEIPVDPEKMMLSDIKEIIKIMSEGYLYQLIKLI